MDKLYIVIPAYNEEENIEGVIKQWYPYIDSFAGEKEEGGNAESRLVIADSGSTDNTHSILLGLQESFPQIEILSDTNRYHGPKVITLYKYAIAKEADYILCLAIKKSPVGDAAKKLDQNYVSPRASRYSRGLRPPRDTFIRFSLYQCM